MIGYILLRENQPYLAMEPLKEVLSEKPDYRDANALMGACYLQVSDYGQAYSYISNAHSLDPNYPMTNYFFAKYYESKNEPTEAQEYFTQALYLEPENENFRVDYISFLLNQFSFQKAAEEYEILIKYHPKEEYKIKLAYLYLDSLEENEKGMNIAENLFKNSQEGEILNLYGWALYKNNKLSEALENLNQAVEKNPTSDLAYYHLSVVQKKLGKTSESQKSLERALDLDLDGDISEIIGK